MTQKIFDYMKRVVNHQFVMPCDIELHPTSACNHDCIWCIMMDQRKKGGQLSYEELKSIAIQMYKSEDMKYIFISGGGEPLMNENLFKRYEFEGKDYSDYFHMLKEFGISIGMSSNGELLSKVIELGCYRYIDELRISVDAGTEEQYKKLHKSRKCFSLKSLVKSIEEYYKVSGKPLQLSYLIHEINDGSYVDLANMFSESKAVSKIDVKNLYGDEEGFGEEYKDVVINGMKINFKRKRTIPEYNYSGVTNLLINHNGEVYPCCHMIEENRNYLGSVRESSIEEMIKKSFKQMQECNCEKCAGLGKNYMLSEFKSIGGDRYDTL